MSGTGREMTDGRQSVVPANDEWFNLEVDNNIALINLVTSVGFPKDLVYFGPKLTGRKIYRAKLTQLGYARNLAEAKKKANAMSCRLIVGQAGESFMIKFPKPDRNGPIILGGSEWRYPDGHSSSIYLNAFEGEWRAYFFCSGDKFGIYWRWLVVGK